MLSVLSFLFACQTMDDPGSMFKQVSIAQTTASNSGTNTKKEPKEAVDPMFQSREEVLVVGGDPVEEPNEKEEHSEETVKSNEPEHSSAEEKTEVVVEKEEIVIPPVQAIASPQSLRVSRVKDGWRPTLIASVMEGPTPRAILAMPSGEEKIVKAGDLLSDEGVVVMTIGSSFVELAVINSEEGRAKIENLTLTEQF